MWGEKYLSLCFLDAFLPAKVPVKHNFIASNTYWFQNIVQKRQSGYMETIGVTTSVRQSTQLLYFDHQSYRKGPNDIQRLEKKSPVDL